MDTETRKEVDAKIAELRQAHDEARSKWHTAKRELEQAEDSVEIERNREADPLNPGERLAYIQAAAHAYGRIRHERVAYKYYNDLHEELASAIYIDIMDDDDDANPSEQQMAVARLLYGDD